MFSPFLGVFGTWVAMMGMCQAGNLDRSRLVPLSIVYTVYPYYNSDPLLEIWKAEEPRQVSNDVNVLGRRYEGQETRNVADAGIRDSTSGSNDRKSSHSDSEETVASRNQGTNEITYWPPVQRGAAPKPRLTRATGLRTSNVKSNI